MSSDLNIDNIDARFCGPPHCGNGGYTAGLLAELLSGTVEASGSAPEQGVEVTLRAPSPLGVALRVGRSPDGGLSLHADETLIAEARPAPLELALPDAVSVAEAERASVGFPGYAQHPYPGCFVCGPERQLPDGLCLFPGPASGRRVAAAPWLPGAALCDAQGMVRERFVWAALDCPSWWGHASFASEVAPILLGRLTLRVNTRPRRDQPCVVTGWPVAREGRRIICGSALFDAAGLVLAYAQAIWIELKA